MNYNANTGPRQPAFGKKVKRVPDVNSMGFNPYNQEPGSAQNLYPNLGPIANSLQQDYMPQQQPYENQGYTTTPKGPPGPGFNYNAPAPSPYQNSMPMPTQNLGVLGQPMVQNMAMQYGQQLAGAGKTMIKEEVEKYVPVTKLKYYFAVDTKYVISKLMLLFFPFTHSDWSVKYEQDGPVQPRYEINAPDLYIPTMAYVTYILVASLVLGMQDRFSPEQLGIISSSALAWCILELAVYSCTLYILQVETSLRTLDLLAYSGYKFVGTIVSVLVSLVGGKTGFYCCLVYVNLALAFFLVRSLKVQVLAEKGAEEHSYYGSAQSAGHKRRLYILLFVAAIQPVLSWWFSYHLLPYETVSSGKTV